MELVDFIVLGGEKVIACAYVYNTGKDEASYLSIARMEKGSKSIALKQLDFTAEMTITNGILRQVPGTDLVALFRTITGAVKGHTTYYATFLSFLKHFHISHRVRKNNRYSRYQKSAQTIFGTGEDFKGIPQDFYVNGDGTYTWYLRTYDNYLKKYNHYYPGSIGVTCA